MWMITYICCNALSSSLDFQFAQLVQLYTLFLWGSMSNDHIQFQEIQNVQIHP